MSFLNNPIRKQDMANYPMPDYSKRFSQSSGTLDYNAWIHVFFSNYNNNSLVIGGLDCSGLGQHGVSRMFPLPQGVAFSSSNGATIIPCIGG